MAELVNFKNVLEDLEQAQKDRDNARMTDLANQVLDAAVISSRIGLGHDLIIRAVAIGLARLIADLAEPGHRLAIAQAVAEILPDLVNRADEQKPASPDDNPH